VRDRLIADANRRKWIVSETHATTSVAAATTPVDGVGLLFESADGRERRISRDDISVNWLSAADPELLKLLETATPLPRRVE
jgi:hypothetical protein